MKNEGIIERGIQTIISASLFLGAFFRAEGKLQVILFILAGMIWTFAVIGFCPLYALIGKNKNVVEKNKRI